jgi:hypothetical protein
MADTSRERQESLELPRIDRGGGLQRKHCSGDFEAQPKNDGMDP